MPQPVIDFEGGGVTNQPTTPVNTDVNPANQEDVHALDGKDVADVNEKDTTNEQSTDNNQSPVEESNDETSSLEVGTQIDVDGTIYTVAENGDLVDKDNKVFKEAKDVNAWLKENNVEDEEESGDLLTQLQNELGVEITDDNGNSVEFTNDAKGVKSYVEAVIANKANDISQGAINRLFAAQPMLKQFIDYVQLTGSPRGFGDLPDRSGIQLDKDNKQQLIAVIRMAAQEFGNKSLNDNYINYLDSAGALYDEASAQLQALVQKDQQVREQIEQEAQKAREQEEQDLLNYWQGVANAIDKRVISGYKIPETFVKEINGQKITLTPNDFYDYLSKTVETDEQGNVMTGYQRDLNNLTDEEALNRELLDAWLMFTGGSYKDLVNMAIKENEVRRLVVKSKQQRSAKTIKVVKANQGKVNPEDILF